MQNINHLESHQIEADTEYLMCINDGVLLSIEFIEESLSIHEVLGFDQTGVDHSTHKLQDKINNGTAVWCTVIIRATSSLCTGYDTMGCVYDASFLDIFTNEVSGYLPQLIDEAVSEILDNHSSV